MDTKVINNREEFEDFYFYDKKYMKEEHYPTEYPCLVTKEDVDAGIAGSQVVHQIIYCPDDCMEYSFFAALLCMYDPNCESDSKDMSNDINLICVERNYE